MVVPTVSSNPSLEHVFHADDIERVFALRDFMRHERTGAVLNAILPAKLPPDAWSIVLNECTLVHAGLLVFPNNVRRLLECLPYHGLTPSAVTPSVVVRDRLVHRYGLDSSSLQVHITHAAITATRRRELELFLLQPDAQFVTDGLIATERATNSECHFAFVVRDASELMVTHLHRIFSQDCGLVCDGGGINVHEDVSVFYFKRPGRIGRWPRRLELLVQGRHPGLIDTHLMSATTKG